MLASRPLALAAVKLCTGTSLLPSLLATAGGPVGTHAGIYEITEWSSRPTTLKCERALESPRGLVPTPAAGAHTQSFRVTRPGVAPNSLCFQVIRMLLAWGPHLKSCWPRRMKVLELRNNFSKSNHEDLCAKARLSVYIINNRTHSILESPWIWARPGSPGSCTYTPNYL